MRTLSSLALQALVALGSMGSLAQSQPVEPAARVAARVKSFVEIHTSIATVTEECVRLERQIFELNGRLEQGAQQFRALQQALPAAQAAFQQAQGALREAESTSKSVQVREAFKVTDPVTGKKRTQYEYVTKRVPKTLAERKRDLERARPAMAAASGNLQQIVASGRQLETDGPKWKTQLEEARRGLPAAQKKALSLFPLWLEQTDFTDRMSRFEQEALCAQCDEWLKQNPTDTTALIARAALRHCLKQTNEALADAELAGDAPPGEMRAVALALRAALLVAKQNDADALREFARAIKERPCATVYLLRGLAHRHLERYGAAEADFKAAARADRDHIEPDRLLALLYAASPRMADSKKALHHANKACEAVDPDDWAVLDALAAAQAEAGDFEDACTTIQKAAQLALGDKQEQCLARLKLYQLRQPLRLESGRAL